MRRADDGGQHLGTLTFGLQPSREFGEMSGEVHGMVESPEDPSSLGDGITPEPLHS